MKKTILLAFSLFITLLMHAQTSTAPTNGDGSYGNPYQIATLDNLYWLSQTSTVWNKYYIQTANIDASTTSTWDGGSGFLPIGSGFAFTGLYNGQGYSINGLTINRPTSDKVGLFAYAQGIVENIQLIGSSIKGRNCVGSIAGYNYASFVTNCYSSGSISGTGEQVGGVVGFNYGDVINSYSICAVNGETYYVGGVSGLNRGTITNCYNKGTVTGPNTIGGVVGWNYEGGNINNCYNIGAISNTINYEGGVVGWNSGIITNCYNAGTTSGVALGGVYSMNSFNAIINRCYWNTDLLGNNGTNSGTYDGSIGEPIYVMKGSYFVTLLNTYKGSWATWIPVSDGYPTFGWAITYNLNGGTNTPANKATYECGKGLTLKAPTQTGFAFSGWYDNAAFTGVAISAINPLATTDITLYAKWVKAYTITYNLDGGTNNPANTATYAYGIGLILNNPTKTGYTFGGWYDNQGFTGTAVTSISSSANSDITLYAKWTANTYSIAYYLDGGINNVANATTYKCGVGLILNNPAKTGYTFGGWFDNADFTGLAITEISTTTADNVNLYAKWTVNTYTITYNLDGGENNAANAPTYTYGVGITISAATKTEYIFAGWYDNENFTGTAVTEISNTTTGDVTLYAKWTEITNTFTITVSTGDKGSITPTGEISVNEGSNQSFTITTNKGYHISDVLVDGASVGAVDSYTFSNVTANHTIAASFKLTTGMGNATTENINLYPNPASDYITIEGAEGTASLFDISGRMVLTQTVSNLSTINISSLTNGIYTLSINGHTMRVIKK